LVAHCRQAISEKFRDNPEFAEALLKFTEVEPHGSAPSAARRSQV